MNFRCYLILFINLFFVSSIIAQQHQKNLNYLKSEIEAIKNIKMTDPAKQLPIVELENLQIASVNLGFKNTNTFDSLVCKYAKVECLESIYNSEKQSSLNALNDDLKFYNYVVLKVEGKIGKSLSVFVKEIEKSKKVVVVQTGAYEKESLTFNSPIISSTLNNSLVASCMAKLIFGGIALNGKPIRLNYSLPEAVGIDASDLDSIGLIVKQVIEAKGTPGAVVMIIKDGNVIFNQAYGTHKYNGLRETRIDDIFDMASITKVAATTNTVMNLVEQNKLSIDSPITRYVAKTRVMSEKSNLKVKEVLLHQAGFFPYIKFYERLKAIDTDTTYSEEYSTQLADGYFLRKNYFNEIMWPEMLQDKLLTRGTYVYSDLSMYYMKEIVEKVSSTSLDIFSMNNFYKPLGMQRAGFLPRKRFNKDEIVPTTENDGWLRYMPVQGFVNDPGAAMLGGVSGHAGFFASANDMAILGQMWLNYGQYGGKQYFKPETIKIFTAKQSLVSRRGYGFDRKDPDPSKGYPSKLASDKVFGHTGYTGTAIWVDPKYNLVYVFLSNRVYPDDKNKSLNTLNIRARIMDVIYRAIK